MMALGFGSMASSLEVLGTVGYVILQHLLLAVSKFSFLIFLDQQFIIY